MSYLLIDKIDHRMEITLNRPEIRNAMDESMQVDLVDALTEASKDLEVRSVIITGAGDAFCSGADTRRITSGKDVFEGTSAPLTRHRYAHGVQVMSRAFYDCEVPLIAAVNGPALGLGFDLTTQCDMRIAAENAIFSEAFITFGLIPGDGGFWYLPRIVGYSRAVELTITGRRIDAKTAERWGLVSEVVPPGEALNAARRLADEIAARPPQTVRMSKRLVRDASETSLHEALNMGAMAQAVLTGSDDQKEAAAAMKEKRDADFSGR